MSSHKVAHHLYESDDIAEVKSTIFYDSWNEIILLEVLGENIEFV